MPMQRLIGHSLCVVLERRLVKVSISGGVFLLSIGVAAGYLSIFLPRKRTLAVKIHLYSSVDITEVGMSSIGLSCDVLHHMGNLFMCLF
jgi:hypothetical protein